MQMVVNLGQLPPLVRHQVMTTLHHEDAAAHALGMAEQIELKKLMDDLAQPGFNRELRSSMILSRGQWLAANRLAEQSGTLLSDPDFSKWLFKKHDAMRVKDVGTRIQSGFTGKGDSRG